MHVYQIYISELDAFLICSFFATAVFRIYMPLSLGEKLRQAREERGISISEVAEQTRISPHYLKSIENNDFKILPGGIFNKGFIKSFARYVGVDESEAVQDYILALGEPENGSPDEPKPYHPQVLTDDRTSSSMAPTILFAVLILALMTAGILFVVRYLLSPSTPANQVTATLPPGNNETSAANTIPSNSNSEAAPVGDKISVELKALTEPVWISYSIDGVPKNQTLAPNESLKLDALDNLKISYSKAKMPNLEVMVNGRRINIPPPIKGTVELDINKSNVNQLVQAGQDSHRSDSNAGLHSCNAGSDSKCCQHGAEAFSRTRKIENAKTIAVGHTETKPTPTGTVIVVGPPKPTPAKSPN